MHCLFCLFGCDHIVSVPSHGPHVPPFPPPSCWYNWKAIMRWCAVCTFVDLQKTFVSENQCLILNWFFTMGFHKNSEMKPIQPSSSVGMGDLCRRVWHTWATLICQLEIVTKAYGLIQTTYMVLLWLLILPIILALKVAWSINCTITFQTQLAFFFFPQKKISEDGTLPIFNDFSIVPHGEYKLDNWDICKVISLLGPSCVPKPFFQSLNIVILKIMKIYLIWV